MAEGGGRFLVVLNLGGGAYTLDLSGVAPTATIAVTMGMLSAGMVDLARLEIAPNEGLVLRL